jgi:hypothetical protein
VKYCLPESFSSNTFFDTFHPLPDMAESRPSPRDR